MSTAKGKAANKKVTADDGDDDWAVLTESTAKVGAPTPGAVPTAASAAASAAAPMTDAEKAAAAYLAQAGLVVDAGSAGGADKKKKKKKKGGKGGDEDAKPPAAGDEDAAEADAEGAVAAPVAAAAAAGGAKTKQTAQGRVIAARLAKQREEEERLRKLAEEEERLRLEEEAKEEAERQRIEEEKQRKKDKAREKLEKKKREGTYKTKKQKEQEMRAKAALEAMVASGQVDLPANGEAPVKKGKPSYGKRKQRKGEAAAASAAPSKPAADEDAEDHDDSEDEEEGAASEEAISTMATAGSSLAGGNGSAVAAEEEEEGGGWEEAADAWDEADVTDLLEHIQIKDPNAEEEDQLDAEKAAEQEKLRKQGIRQRKVEEKRRQEEEERRKEEEEREREVLQAERAREAAKARRLERESLARRSRTRDSLRSPIVCIMGHVDTGKTKLLDKIRQTNVQEGEAGGITQQIGATFFPRETILEKIASVSEGNKFHLRLPGMLIIDTPGHESFTNLRSRGSSLCDIAILVIDLMHGLEPQTVESLNLLRSKKTPFVAALNKIDRCYGWKATPNGPIQDSLALQDENTRGEFEDRASRIRVELMEKGLNAELYWKNADPLHTVSLVPTSAITGEGVPDLLMWLAKLTQERLQEQIMFMPDLLECTVLEVKAIDGLGMTIDVIIVNGHLNEGDQIVVCTLDGPVVTTIRALLTPPPSREMRVKSEYIHHKVLSGAIGAKICANGIEKAVAGTSLMVIGPDDDPDDIKEEVMKDMTNIMKMDLEPRGVLVQASTLGALEALMQFLRKECDPPIPVSAVNIGPVYKKDVVKASIMLDKGCSEFATILAFDVRIDSDARTHADQVGVRIFTADIIYHLFDQFTAFMTGLTEQRRADAATIAVFPCIVKVMPQHIFNQKDPIIVGMEVIEGTLRVGTPLCIPALEGLEIGRVASIENNHNEVTKLAKGSTGAVRIEGMNGGSTLTYGRQFSADSGSIYSKISRESIDALKEHFRSQVTKDDLRLIVAMKKVFGIQ